jgi:hypothetical protein
MRQICSKKPPKKIFDARASRSRYSSPPYTAARPKPSPPYSHFPLARPSYHPRFDTIASQTVCRPPAERSKAGGTLPIVRNRLISLIMATARCWGDRKFKNTPFCESGIIGTLPKRAISLDIVIGTCCGDRKRSRSIFFLNAQTRPRGTYCRPGDRVRLEASRRGRRGPGLFRDGSLRPPGFRRLPGRLRSRQV